MRGERAVRISKKIYFPDFKFGRKEMKGG